MTDLTELKKKVADSWAMREQFDRIDRIHWVEGKNDAS